MEGWRWADENSVGGPVPQVLQNQLDRQLGNYIGSIEQHSLKTLQIAMLKRVRAGPEAIFLAAVVILHIIERDIWRLEHWLCFPNQVRTLTYCNLVETYHNRNTNGDILSPESN